MSAARDSWASEAGRAKIFTTAKAFFDTNILVYAAS